jgi:hypothetical protein
MNHDLVRKVEVLWPSWFKFPKKIDIVQLDTLISFTSAVMSVSYPRKTCKEASKSSIIPILACPDPIHQEKKKYKEWSEQIQKMPKIEHEWVYNHTSHRGDSGMKNKPRINRAQGKHPANQSLCSINKKKYSLVNYLIMSNIKYHSKLV